MKTRKKKSYFGLGTGKFFVILLVVLASAYFIWQFMFIQNSQGTKAKDFKDVCCRSSQGGCSTGYVCVKGGSASCPYGICQKKSDMNAQRTGPVNLKCNCDSEFGECEDKWGETNIQSRECKFAATGSETCNYRVRGKLYQWVYCDSE